MYFTPGSTVARGLLGVGFSLSLASISLAVNSVPAIHLSQNGWVRFWPAGILSPVNLVLSISNPRLVNVTSPNVTLSSPMPSTMYCSAGGL